jgi:hypothetical protein
LKKNKTCFDEGCTKLLDERKEVTLLRLHEPSEINGDNLNNIRVKPAGISGKKEGVSEIQN